MSTSPTTAHFEGYSQPIHREQAKKKENPNLRSNAFLARLLGFKQGGLNTSSEFKPEKLPSDRTEVYGLLNHAAAAERNLFWEAGDNKSLSPEEKKAKSFGGWSNLVLERFGKKEGELNGGIIETGVESDFFEKVGIQLGSLDDAQIEKFYLDFCGGGKSVETFIGKMASTFSPEEITANIDKIQFLAGMFGEGTAKDVVGLLTNPEDRVLIEQVGDNTAVTGEEEKSRLEFLSSLINEDGGLRDLEEILPQIRTKENKDSQTFRGVHSEITDQGGRGSQEDRTLISQVGEGVLYGIFDGHGGDKVAQFAQEHVAGFFEEFLKQGFAPEEALRSALMKVDSDLPENIEKMGSTATLMYKSPDGKLYLANLGDSEAVVFDRDGKLEELTYLHSGSNPKEQARLGNSLVRYGEDEFRIENNEGGALAVTAALGDRGYTDLLRTPHISNFQTNSKSSLAVLASDGLWSILPKEALWEVLHGYTKNNPNSTLEDINKHLRDTVYARAKEYKIPLFDLDNISIILVNLEEGKL